MIPPRGYRHTPGTKRSQSRHAGGDTLAAWVGEVGSPIVRRVNY